jgi:site-specific recombinase XerC
MLGHRDLSSTLIYSKVDFKALNETALPWPEVTKL